MTTKDYDLSNNASVRALMHEATKVLNLAFAEQGIRVELRKAQLGLNQVEIRFVFQQQKEDAAISVKKTWENLAHVFGLKPEWFGRRLILQGTPYEIVGLHPNRPKNCVQLLRLKDRKVFVTTPHEVARQLTQKETV